MGGSFCRSLAHKWNRTCHEHASHLEKGEAMVLASGFFRFQIGGLVALSSFICKSRMSSAIVRCHSNRTQASRL